MRITIGIINPSESEKYSIQVPDDIQARQVKDAIVEELGLPSHGNNGRRLNYRLNVRDQNNTLQRLNENETLAENEVGNDSVLQLTVEMTAGGYLSQ